MPASRITASSPACAGSQALQLGMVAATRWLEPSWCCRPSPPSVVRPEVAPSRKPRALVELGRVQDALLVFLAQEAHVLGQHAVGILGLGVLLAEAADQRMQAALVDAKLRAESASQAKTQFLATMSHE